MAKQKSQKELSKKHLAHSERTQKQQRLIIIGISIIVGLVILVLAYGILDQTVLHAQQPVAKVGNIKISGEKFRNQTQLARIENVQQFNYDQTLLQFGQQLGNFDLYLQAYYDMQKIQSQMSDANTFASSYLDAMVDDILISQQASKLDPVISVSDAEVDESIQKLFGYYPNGTPTRSPTETVWVTPTYSRTQLAILGPTKTPTVEPTLDATALPTAAPTTISTSALSITATPAVTLGPESSPTAYTFEGYRKNLDDYVKSLKTYNVTEGDLRDYWKAQLLRQKVFDSITSGVSNEAEQVWARHILVASEEEAKKVLARIKAGEDWSTIASEVSIDTATKSTGGDLSWFPKGVMVKEFEDAAFSMKVGEISQPIKTTMGYHIIEVLGHENRPLSARYLSAAKQQVYSDWITKLRAETTITKNDIWKEFIPTVPTVEMPAAQ